MRVTPEDYQTIRGPVLAHYAEDPEHSDERVRWDSLWRALQAGDLSWDILNPYLDTHIDTALRRIQREVRL